MRTEQMKWASLNQLFQSLVRRRQPTEEYDLLISSSISLSWRNWWLIVLINLQQIPWNPLWYSAFSIAIDICENLSVQSDRFRPTISFQGRSKAFMQIHYRICSRNDRRVGKLWKRLDSDACLMMRGDDEGSSRQDLHSAVFSPKFCWFPTTLRAFDHLHFPLSQNHPFRHSLAFMPGLKPDFLFITVIPIYQPVDHSSHSLVD
jgi:hypothetical protein